MIREMDKREKRKKKEKRRGGEEMRGDNEFLVTEHLTRNAFCFSSLPPLPILSLLISSAVAFVVVVLI